MASLCLFFLDIVCEIGERLGKVSLEQTVTVKSAAYQLAFPSILWGLLDTSAHVGVTILQPPYELE